MKPKTRNKTSYSTFEIRTPRLIIRALQASDYSVWLDANRTLLPAQNRFDGGKRTKAQSTPAAFKKMLAARKKAWAADQYYMMNQFHRKTGELVGFTIAVNVMPHLGKIFRMASLGNGIHNQHWQQGYANESLAAVVRFAFKQLQFQKLLAEIDTDNRASMKMVEKVGFRLETTVQEWFSTGRKRRDAHIYTIVRGDPVT